MLTKATVFPNLKVLAKYFPVIYLATIERRRTSSADIPEGVLHVPYYSLTNFPRFIEKLTDLLFFSWKVIRLSRKAKVDVVICRGAMAATFGVFIFKIFRIPFMVESFEPHADYMLEGGTWAKSSSEFKFQKWIEKQTIQHAAYLLPVANNYAEYLKTKLFVHTSRIIVMPCAVNIAEFSFSSSQRSEIRSKLGLKDDLLVGIYVGKFGDIYLDDKAFEIFKHVFKFFDEKFFLIILTPQDNAVINLYLSKFEISKEKVFVAFIDHALVPGYLSAADFAFSLIRPSLSRSFCSPIKNGEYWANGLPVLIPDGIGDDSQILKSTGLGVVMEDLKHPEKYFRQLENLIRKNRREEIKQLAVKYRNPEVVKESYQLLLKESSLTH